MNLTLNLPQWISEPNFELCKKRSELIFESFQKIVANLTLNPRNQYSEPTLNLLKNYTDLIGSFEFYQKW